jgi:arylsulfatase A-like enzyme
MKQTQNRRDFLKAAALSTLWPLLPGCSALHTAAPAKRKPNIVLILLDDSGWADFEPFGTPDYSTPNVRQLAAEGCRFNNFYVPQAICSASRASLLTGCYPERTKIFAALAPGQKGLDPKYAVMPEVFAAAGCKTAIFGKWHLGDQDGTRPWDRGFDESCGLLYSNDMWEFHPENPDFWGRYPLRYFENGKVTIDRVTPEHQPMLTTWYTEKAVDFIARRKDQPFFLYVPHTMPHVPLFVSDKFKGKSGRGLYADVMMELDWSVGQITKALRDNGLEDDTIVIFSSDNGPWLSYGNHAGKTPFREGKATSFDGGIRSACIIKYPGRIPAGASSDQMFSSVDLLPTLAALNGSPLSANPIDGQNVWDLISLKPGAVNPHDYYPITCGNQFQGILSGDGRWKLLLAHSYRSLAKAGADGAPGRYKQNEIDLSLFDLRNDPGETADVKDKYPDVLNRLQSLARQHKAAFFPPD